MARLARVVVPGLAHHVTQRGNRGLETFFGPDDYKAYRSLLADGCERAGTKVWAYCLMPTQVHLILVPKDPDGLRAALGEAHRRYTRRINERQGWSGHLWRERFHSFPFDEAHLAIATRHVELAPIRARLARKVHRWPWSSAPAHLAGKDDELVAVGPLLKRFPDWAAFLAEGLSESELALVTRHEHSGRPLARPATVTRLEKKLGRKLKAGKPGRPRKAVAKRKAR
ncbi:MAG: transposase [Pseudomonadota bacterium]